MPMDSGNEAPREMRCVLYADPRMDSDQKSIEAFSLSRLPGVVVPTGASAGGPELVCGDRKIVGNGPIQDYLRKNGG
jgi:hypothetical protein